MKTLMKFIASICLMAASVSQVYATPTKVVLTPCTTEVVAKDTLHIDVDNYFSPDNGRRKLHALPTDIGLEAGIFSWRDVNTEVGVDYLGGVNDPLYFNVKASVDEDKFFDKSPSLSVGIFNVGTAHHTNQFVLDLILGKTLKENLGKVFAGIFHGKRAFGKDRTGLMVAYQKGFCPTKLADGKEFNKWQVGADYATGKNSIGGLGMAVSYFFTPFISLATGPIWFNHVHNHSKWMWTVQLGINIP